MDEFIIIIGHITNTMKLLGISMGDIYGAVAIIITSIKLLREKKYRELKDLLETESLRVLNDQMSNSEKVQHLVDFAQSKSKFFAAIPDKMLIDIVNEVYVNRVKPKADCHNLREDKAKDDAGKPKESNDMEVI